MQLVPKKFLGCDWHDDDMEEQRKQPHRVMLATSIACRLPSKQPSALAVYMYLFCIDI
jgi:hypothetical protein